MGLDFSFSSGITFLPRAAVSPLSRGCRLCKDSGRLERDLIPTNSKSPGLYVARATCPLSADTKINAEIGADVVVGGGPVRGVEG